MSYNCLYQISLWYGRGGEGRRREGRRGGEEGLGRGGEEGRRGGERRGEVEQKRQEEIKEYGTEQELNGNLTSQMSSLNKSFFNSSQSFIHRVNITNQGNGLLTKHLFCFIGSLGKKMGNTSSSSSLFISNLNQAARI